MCMIEMQVKRAANSLRCQAPVRCQDVNVVFRITVEEFGDRENILFPAAESMPGRIVETDLLQDQFSPRLFTATGDSSGLTRTTRSKLPIPSKPVFPRNPSITANQAARNSSKGPPFNTSRMNCRP